MRATGAKTATAAETGPDAQGCGRQKLNGPQAPQQEGQPHLRPAQGDRGAGERTDQGGPWPAARPTERLLKKPNPLCCSDFGRPTGVKLAGNVAIRDYCHHCLPHMYQKQNNGQLSIDEFHLPFGGKLDPDNRWVLLSELIPWQELEETYVPQFNATIGAPAMPVRLAFGSLFIKQRSGLTDDETVQQIRENAYMQFFLGFSDYSSKTPFDPSMIVHFRKRYSDDDLRRINELVVQHGKDMLAEFIASQPDEDDSDDQDSSDGGRLSIDDFIKPADWPEGKNWGTLTIDASCTPADITYPTDLKLLNEARTSTERIIDDLCEIFPEVAAQSPRYDRRKARLHFLNVAKQKKPRRRKLKAAVRRQLSYLQRNLEAIDALIAAGARLSCLKRHWWHKLRACSELRRQQSVLIASKTRSIPDRLVNLVQRQVRPIVRGKARAAVEFGAKISVSVQNSFPFLHRIS